MKSTKDCLKLLQQGDQNRVFASTEMNANSSRSHAIVIVTVFKRRKRAITRNENGQEVTGQYAPACCMHAAEGARAHMHDRYATAVAAAD